MKGKTGNQLAAVSLWLCFAMALSGGNALAQRWDYTNIITDQQQSGQYPNLLADAAGNLHATYWNELEDRLVYAIRNNFTGQWTFEPIASDAGFRCALKLDSQQRPTIAFFANSAGKMKLMYGVRTTAGVWNIEQVSDSTWGNYGPNWQFANTRPQASLDLLLMPNGSPRIVFFDARFDGCFLGSTIGYEMQWAIRQGPGVWSINSFGNLPNLPYDLGWESCESTYSGERYGEFCKAYLTPGGFPQIFAFAKTSGVFKRWFATVADPETFQFGHDTLDNNERIIKFQTQSPDPKWYPKCSFEGLSVDMTPDSAMHFVYASSDAYGTNGQTILTQLINGAYTVMNHNCFVLSYLRLNADGSRDTLINFANSLTPADPFKYRTFSHITHRGSDTLYFSVANPTDNEYRVYYSFDGGDTWQESQLMTAPGILRMAAPLAVTGNTLHALAFDSETNRLLHGTHAADMTGSWSLTPITNTDARGASMAACLDPTTPEDVHVAYSDWLSQILVYGKRTAGVWAWDTVNSSPSRANRINLAVHPATGRPTIVYSGELTNQVTAATRTGGIWTLSPIDVSTPGDYLSMAASQTGDTLHIAYYDPANRALRYARSLNGSWVLPVETIDTDLDDRIGEHAHVALDRAGIPHIAYLRTYITGTMQDSVKLRLARRLAQNQWQRTDVAEDENWAVVGSVSLRFGSDNQPRVAFYRFDPFTDSVFTYAWRDAQNVWHQSSMQSLFQGAESMPISFVLDSLDHPLLVFGMQTVPADVQMATFGTPQASQFNWFPVDNNLPNGQIAQVFNLLQDGNRLVIVGRKNRVGDRGLAMLEMPDYRQWLQTTGTATGITVEGTLQAVLYPNPASASAQLRIQQPTGGTAVLQVTDVQGRIVLTQNVPLPNGEAQVQLPIADWAPGIYTYTLRTELGTVAGKLVRIP